MKKHKKSNEKIQAKILITGGHLTPALAVMEKLLLSNRYKLFYAGRKYALEGDNALSLEYKIINQEMKIPFFRVINSRLQRNFSRYTIPSLIRFPFACIHSITLLFQVKPDLVLSFGGYLALPLAMSAKILKIPIITHEQTRVLGLSNKIIARFAEILCLSWEDTKNIPSGLKIAVTGLPIRETVLHPQNLFNKNFGKRNYPIIFVTGGSLGSEAINDIIFKTLPRLLSKYRIIHQCGSANGKKDLIRLKLQSKRLPSRLKNNYLLFEHINPSLIGAIYQVSDLVVSRSGANTCVEILACGKKAILIPLPWSAAGEQLLNARFVENYGLAVVLPQNRVNPNIFLSIISKHLKYKARKNPYFYEDATGKITEIIRFLIFNK